MNMGKKPVIFIIFLSSLFLASIIIFSPSLAQEGVYCVYNSTTNRCDPYLPLPANNIAAELLAADIGVPVSVTLSVIGTGAFLMTASAGSASFAINLSQALEFLKFFRFYLLGMVRIKKKKPWGKVIDKLTGRPIPLALIQIFSAEFNKQKDAHLTDAEGRFDALALPGKYYIVVSKKGYKTANSNVISIDSPTQILNLEISLAPQSDFFGLNHIKKINYLNSVKRILQAINPFILAIGTISSFAVLATLPTALNYFLFGLYLLLDTLNIYFSYHLKKPFGTVMDASSKDLLPLSVVRIFDDTKNWLLDTKVTDRSGRFYFLLVPGQYHLTCQKNEYAPYHSDTISVAKSGVADFDIKMKPLAR